MDLVTKADIRLIGRAVRNGWPVDDELKASVISQLKGFVSGGDPKLSVEASKVLLAADALNLKKEQQEQKRIEAEHARKLQLIEVAARIGLNGADAGGTGGGDTPAPVC